MVRRLPTLFCWFRWPLVSLNFFWSQVTLSLNVLKNIMDSDPSYVEEFGRKHAASADDRKKKLFLRRAAWDAMKPFKP